MAVRTQEIRGIIINGAGVPQAGITVTAQLLVPTNARALSSAGEVIDLAPLTAPTDAAGAYDFSPAGAPPNGLIPPGDIYQWSGGLLVPLPGCAWQISYLSTTIISPAFGYSGSPIDPATWVPPLTTLGLLKMDLSVILGNAQAVQGVSFGFSLNADATWTGGIGTGQLIDSSRSFSVQTDAAGRLYAYLIRQGELSPADGYYIAAKAGSTGLLNGLTFACPAAYTNDAGVWSNAATYGIGQVVRDPATDEPYISRSGGNSGHSPAATLGTWWDDYPGEPIRPGVALAASSQLGTQANIPADPAEASGPYAVPAATLLDQLRRDRADLEMLKAMLRELNPLLPVRPDRWWQPAAVPVVDLARRQWQDPTWAGAVAPLWRETITVEKWFREAGRPAAAPASTAHLRPASTQRGPQFP